ncbi:hypothetical protein AB0D59_01250 [Streptomyces sp. NPDC048417]|uniref:hypothetical protein n=1 Tax=Streptomyces sp. NPDC048417 TaxID=3155387 RepID=UPI00341521E9
MAALAKTTVTCPGCHETIALTLRLDKDAKPGPGELVLAVDRSTVEQHLTRAHTETALR